VDDVPSGAALRAVTTLSYPGVYVDEVPTGGARAIIAVPTSITAFVGTAPRGVINVPVTITSFAAYERAFGPLATSNPLSVAVFQWYANLPNGLRPRNEDRRIQGGGRGVLREACR
jgi:hypothetical protein